MGDITDEKKITLQVTTYCLFYIYIYTCVYARARVCVYTSYINDKYIDQCNWFFFFFL